MRLGGQRDPVYHVVIGGKIGFSAFPDLGMWRIQDRGRYGSNFALVQ